MTNKLLPLLALPVLFLASCGGTSTPSTSTPAPSAARPAVSAVIKDAGSQTKSADEQSVLDQINVARATARMCGTKQMPAAAPVTWNGYLAVAAKGHAQDIADKGYFGHDSQDGRTMTNRVEAAGYAGWLSLGENIAAGYTAKDVVQGWLESPSHCETLMDGKLKEVGLSYVFKANSKFGTYWVSDFGTR